MALHGLSGVALIAGVALAYPAFAQPAADPNVSAQGTSTSGPGGTLQQTHGDWRSSQLVGATVYNDKDVSIGTIDNLLVGSDGKIQQVVISVGGFLGIDSKFVEIPFDHLKFEKSRRIVTGAPVVGASPPGTNGTPVTAPSPTAVNPAPAQLNYYSIVLPNATKGSLTSMQAFTYSG